MKLILKLFVIKLVHWSQNVKPQDLTLEQTYQTFTKFSTQKFTRYAVYNLV